MELSREEQDILKNHPRMLDDLEHCFKFVSNRRDITMIRVIHFLVRLYVADCSIPLQEALSKASQKYSVKNEEEIVEYLKEILLFPYLHKDKSESKHAMEISTRVFNKQFHSLEEAKEGLKEYLSDPNLLLQHLAYCSSVHSRKIEDFVNLTLRLPKENEAFEVTCESISLLCIQPTLTKDALVHLLAYRLGCCHCVIHQVLNYTIESIFCKRAQEYLYNFGIEKEYTIFQLCQIRATHMVNSSRQF